MHLTKSVEDARKLVFSIPHKACAKAIGTHWKVAPDGKVRAQSVFWLFCWAKTGMSSENARQVSVRVFDEILPITFTEFDAAVDHGHAREARYAARNVEHELEELLDRHKNTWA